MNVDFAELLGEAAQIEEVSDNVVRATTSAGDVAVKLFVGADIARAEREAALLAHLADGDGYRVQTLVGLRRHREGAALITTFVEGSKKLYTGITADEWQALGSELAALHVRLDSFPGALPRTSEVTIDLAAERAAIAHAREQAPQYRHYLDERRALLDRFAPYGMAVPPVRELPIHNDYNQHNYLFDGTLPPVILDWEGAIAAPREYEVVRCMNHLPLVAPAHASAFVDGYRSVRALDAAALRWAVDRAYLDHAMKRWPLERLLVGMPYAEAALAGSAEVLHALHDGVAELERFYGVARR